MKAHDLAAITRALGGYGWNATHEYPGFIAVRCQSAHPSDFARFYTIGDANGPGLALQEETGNGDRSVTIEDLHISPETNDAERTAHLIGKRITLALMRPSRLPD